jgi:multidrug efflux pump subunit AcrA (membrane-fusion protein)
MSRRSRAVGTIVGVLAMAIGAAAYWRPAAAGTGAIPTARVVRGPVELAVHTIGEVRSARAMPIFVPATGGQLTIVALAESGSAVKAGEIVVEFDRAEQQFNLEQAQFDLAQAEQEMAKAQAEASVAAAEDDVALLHARFDVRRAELDAKGNDLVGAIQAKENELLLDDARKKLAQLEHDVALKRDSARAAAAGLVEKRNKARAAVAAAQQVLDRLEVRAPFDGYVTRRQNMQAFGGVVFSLAAMPEYRVGDAAYSGQAVGDLMDVMTLEASAKITERDRALVEAGQAIDFHVDGRPSPVLHGRVRSVGAAASRQLFDAGNRQFDVTIELTGDGARPGVTGTLTIHGPTIENALSVPRTAIFAVKEHPTVYVRDGDRFVATPVKVRAQTDTLAVVDSLDPGAVVALVDPASAGTAAEPAGGLSAPAAASRSVSR